tara:strand:+ start:2920 stop:3216 length:297 start_codon:yes stop_codon:yes gene_type:complete
MQIKIHESYRKIIALCDTDLIGKTFEQGIRQIKITPNFFKGKEKNKQEILEILKDMQKEDATFNIVGKESIETALEAGVIEQHGIIKIQDIPIALVLL